MFRYSLFELLRWLSYSSRCMLVASSSRFCLRQFLHWFFWTSLVFTLSIVVCFIVIRFCSICVVWTDTRLICYLVRTTLSFTYLQGFQVIYFVDRVVPKTIDFFVCEMNLSGVFLSSQSIALYIYDVHEERVHDTTSLLILNSLHDLETSGTMNPLLETKNGLHFIRKLE